VVYVISIILSRGRERGAKSERRCFRVRSFAESVPIRMNRYACLLNTSESYEAKTENQLVCCRTLCLSNFTEVEFVLIQQTIYII
jgi:hypothetical protein